MVETSEFLAERLRIEGEKTYAFFSTLRLEQWEQSVYTEESNWTVRNVLLHYVTAEQGFLKIFKGISEGGTGVSDDFDIDRFNASQQKKGQDLTSEKLLELFRDTRALMIDLVISFKKADLEKIGRHPYLGPTTLLEMIKMVYRHNQIHYRDLRKIITEN